MVFSLRRAALAATTVLLVGEVATPLKAQYQYRLLGDFGPGWARRWMEQSFTSEATRFTVAREGDNLVLMAVSHNSASGLWYRFSEPLKPQSGTISWRWKVERAIPQNPREREKRGDDFAARVFVVFDPAGMRRNAEALCYVWASTEPVGSVFANAYFDKVATIVLQSGDERAGEWVAEERDFVADYRRFFGKDPEVVSTVAIMVDTDDTGSTATAWFDDMAVRVRRRTGGAPPPPPCHGRSGRRAAKGAEAARMGDQGRREAMACPAACHPERSEGSPEILHSAALRSE